MIQYTVLHMSTRHYDLSFIITPYIVYMALYAHMMMASVRTQHLDLLDRSQSLHRCPDPHHTVCEPAP